MKFNFDITTKEFLIVKTILEETIFFPCQVFIFGSRAKNKAQDYSDLDLALHTKEKINAKISTQLKNAFEESLLPYTVDIVDINAISTSFKAIVDTHKKLFLSIENKVMPKLRFSEYNNSYCNLILGEASDVRDGTHDSPKYINEGFPLITSKNLMSSGKISFENVNLISENDYLNINKRSKVDLGDILFGMIGTIGNPVIVKDKEFAIKNVALIKQQLELLNSYLIYYLDSFNIQKQFYRQNAGGTQKFIALGLIRKLNINAPFLPEQKKIATFLSTVDEKLQQLTKKKELLAAYKKGIMQQLFSQELRFKDANGNSYPDWEEKKLGEVMSERNIKAPKSNSYPLMSFVAYKGVRPKGKRYNREFLVNDEDNKKYKETEYGDFIYSSNNLETGSIGLNRYGAASISPVYSIFKIGELCNYQFISSYLLRKSFINKMIRFRQGVVYGQWKIHESNFLKIQDKFPSLEEQNKLADFLSSLDSKIELVSTQIENTKAFKKGLLQQMFV